MHLSNDNTGIPFVQLFKEQILWLDKTARALVYDGILSETLKLPI